jgi:AsmA protein
MAEMATIAPASSPPPRKRITGLLGILVFGIVLAGMAAAAVPWLFSTNVLRKEVLAQIQQTTGLVAVSQGRSVFVVLPQPHISIEDISFADPSGALRVGAKYLKGYLRVTSLLRGRLEIASATLGEPQIAVDLDDESMPSDSAIGRAARARPASAQAEYADEAWLGVVSLIDGSARLRRRAGSLDLRLEAINATIDWRKLGSAASLEGTLRFRGQSATISALVERPTELLRGEHSPFSLKIDGPALSLSAQGSLASAPEARFTGTFVATSPSLQQLARTGGYFVELPAPFEDFALNAEANISAESASFSSLHLQVDGNYYEGALALIMSGQKPVLSGTLAADALSLRPFIADRAPTLARDGQWSHDPFDLDAEGFADIDLRVSAAHLTLPGADLEDAAFSVMKQKGRFDLALIEAKAYSGDVKGRTTFAQTGAGVEMRASATATDVDVAAVWPTSVESWRVAGTMSGSGNVESVGASVSELMRNLSGHAQVALERGELGGINLDEALRWIDKKPLGVADDIRYGGTGFEQAGFGLRIAKGVAQIEEGAAMHSRSLDLAFGGSIDFGERMLDIHATSTGSGGAPRPGREPAKFDFDVYGPWDDIALIPDARSLIRQSGAAAPLLSPNRMDIKAPAEGH